MKNLNCILFVFLFSNLYSQKMSKEYLLEDLAQLREAIHAYNPALEIYNPQFDAKADSLVNLISADSISYLEAFKRISQLATLSNEGHFSLGNWQDTVHSGFLANRYQYLPVSVRILDGKIFAWIDNSNEQVLNRGDEILNINGLSSSRILKEIYSATPADGAIETYLQKTVEIGFPWMYYLYVSQPDAFEMELRDTSGNLRAVRIDALTRDEQFDNYDKYYPDREEEKEEAFYDLKIEGSTAFFTLNSFDYRLVDKVKSSKFYKEIFAELQSKNIKNLVVDLRDNTGGRNEFADDIVPFICNRQDDFLKKTLSWDLKMKTYKFPKRAKEAFDEKIYVLVDGRTYSAGSTLARYLNEYADAVIIGEETGTRYEGFVAGSKQAISLQNINVKIGIPRYHIYFPESSLQTTSNRVLIPDLKITYSIQDLIRKRDLHMEKVNKLIEKENRTPDSK